MVFLDAFEKLAELAEVNSKHLEIFPEEIKNAYLKNSSHELRKALQANSTDNCFVDMIDVVSI